MADFGVVGERWGEGNNDSFGGFDGVAVGDLDGGTGVGELDIGAELLGRCVKVVACGSGVGYGGGICVVGFGWDYRIWI